MNSHPYHSPAEEEPQLAWESRREQHLVGQRLSRAYLWAKISLAVAITYAVITAVAPMTVDRPLQAMVPTVASAVVFLVGAVLQPRLIGSRVAQPKRLGRASWNKGLSLLFSVLGSYLAIVAVSIFLSAATGFSRGNIYLGFLLILLLFTAPLGFLLDASTLATKAAANSYDSSAPGGSSGQEWADSKLSRAHLWSRVSLVFALIAAFILGGIGFYYEWALVEKVLLGLSAIVILAAGILQLRIARAQAADPATLGRQSKKRAMTLLWSVLGAHTAIAAAGMIHTFTSGEITFAPTLGFILSGLVLAGPCGTLLDVSRITVRLTGR